MTKYILFTILLLGHLSSYGQRSDYSICDCCTYSMFQFKNDYDDVFSPTLIKSNGVKELTIYTTSRQRKDPKDTTYTIVDSEYKEMTFRFNSDGYVETQIVFNRRGHYHSVYDYTRDNSNKVLTKTFHYLDEIGNKMDDLSEKWIYFYSDNHLTQIKKLDDKFIEQPDNKSDYIAYAYDSLGRVIVETRQLYYDWTESSYYQTKTKYNDASSTSIATTRDKKKLFSIVKTNYTTNQKPANQKFYDGRNNKLLEDEIFTYNPEGQLIKYQVKNSGMGTECPDGGNFQNTITYSTLKLIDKIRHQYKNTVCELRFTYK